MITTNNQKNNHEPCKTTSGCRSSRLKQKGTRYLISNDSSQLCRVYMQSLVMGFCDTNTPVASLSALSAAPVASWLNQLLSQWACRGREVSSSQAMKQSTGIWQASEYRMFILMYLCSSLYSISRYSPSCQRSRGCELTQYLPMQPGMAHSSSAICIQYCLKSWKLVLTLGGVPCIIIFAACVISFINKMDEPPYQLSQKIDFLYERISSVHSEVRRNNDIQLKLNFVEYLDLAIKQIMAIRQYGIPSKDAPLQHSRTVDKNDPKERYQFDKKLMELQIRQLNHKQLEMQVQTLTLKMANLERDYYTLEQTRKAEKRELTAQIARGNDRNRYLEQEIQKLVKLNLKQEQEIKVIREERNRAERIQLQLQQKFNSELGKLEKYQQKLPRYLDRSSQHLRSYRIYTNTSPSPSPTSKKLVTLPLPLTLQVSKLVYGILLGIHINHKQVVYYDKLQLYQKEVTHIEQEEDWLVVTYPRRKGGVRVVLDRYKIRVSEVVVMLGGRGDSVIVHEEASK